MQDNGKIHGLHFRTYSIGLCGPSTGTYGELVRYAISSIVTSIILVATIFIGLLAACLLLFLLFLIWHDHRVQIGDLLMNPRQLHSRARVLTGENRASTSHTDTQRSLIAHPSRSGAEQNLVPQTPFVPGERVKVKRQRSSDPEADNRAMAPGWQIEFRAYQTMIIRRKEGRASAQAR